MIYYSVNSYTYEPLFSTFPGGEEYVRLSQRTHPVGNDGTVTIRAEVQNSSDVMRLILLTNALRLKRPNAVFDLDMPYLPYARQDRLCASGESESLGIFCAIINGLKFANVFIKDCHSLVGLALLNNVKEKTQLQCFDEVTQHLVGKIDAIVAPDAGATKKAQSIADSRGLPLIQCLKERTPSGIKVRVLDDITGKNVLVVDDIIDGGGTFIVLANALESAKTKRLYATHGIFSKGRELLDSLYDEVVVNMEWTSDGFKEYENVPRGQYPSVKQAAQREERS